MANTDDTTTMNVTRKSRRTVASKRARATATPPAIQTEADVARRAYLIYLEEGCPQGRHLDHWLRAESELRG
jgi:Protein of unknown function (DUF2934)